MKSVRTGFLVAIAALFLTAVSAAEASACEAEVKKALQEAQIPQSDVKKITIIAERDGGNAPRITGYTGWVSRNSCSGNFVVNMSTSCRVKSTYSTGECKK